MSISSSEPRLQDRDIVSRWRENAERYPDREAIVCWKAGEEPIRWTFKSLYSRAVELAPGLHALGVQEGHVCGMILSHGPEVYPFYMAVELAGAIPSMLAQPNPRIHPEKYREGLRGMSRRSGLDWILTQEEFRSVIEPLVTESGSLVRGVANVEGIVSGATASSQNHSKGGSRPVLLQHSSGTTGLQKAVVLSHEAVIRHLENYARAIQLSENDKIVSWLPLYHDMGLIAAFHLPLYHGVTSVQLDPFEWVVAPVLLLQALSEERGTVSWLPNFSYNLIADRLHKDEIAGFDLSRVRLLVNCSEPIRASSHRELFSKLEPTGLKASAFSTCYAMAETTFAITQAEPGEPPVVLAVDRKALKDGFVHLVEEGASDKSSRECVSSGAVIQGCTIEIVDDTGTALDEGRVGEIVVRSESMFSGYRNWPEKTAEVFCGDGFLTGDYGFRWKGEFFITGRKKDLIILAGKNIYPEDIEDVASAQDGVMPGRVVACGLEDTKLGTEKICVIAESGLDKSHHLKMSDSIKAAAARIDITVSEVFIVPPRWLIKSSAGKPSRKTNKERIEAMILGNGVGRDF